MFIKIFSFLLVFSFSIKFLISKELDFNRDVRPILSDKCYRCHGLDAHNQKSDYRIHTFDEAIKTVNGSPGIVPGNVKASEVHHRIRTEDENDIMPPLSSHLKLTDKEKDIIDEWIEKGAKYDKHWSLVSLPGFVEVPKTSESKKWATNEIDHFIFSRFNELDLSPSDVASKEKLLRRVSFDLTGLPPALVDIDNFLNDNSTNAYEKVVDRLLSSKQYAERLTSEWLDVARYSDGTGYQQDRDRRVWAWRDWVLNAFYKNMPYDEFIKLQVAGDLVPNASQDQILATAFNRLHGVKMEGGSTAEEFRIEYVSDRTHTFGTAFLGMTLECSKCHNHKYDPITMDDYYSISAFFSNIDEFGLGDFFERSVPTPVLKIKNENQENRLTSLDNQIEKLNDNINSLNLEKEFNQYAKSNSEISLPKDDLVAHVDFEDVKNDKIVKNLINGSNVDVGKYNSIIPSANGNSIKFSGDNVVEVWLDDRYKLHKNLDRKRIKAHEMFQEAKKKFDDSVRNFNSSNNDASFQLIVDKAKKKFESAKRKLDKLTKEMRIAYKKIDDKDTTDFDRHNQFSISVKIKVPKFKDRYVVLARSRAWTDAGSRGYELLLEDGKMSVGLIHFWPGNAIRVKSKNKITLNKWATLAFTYDGSSKASGVKLYVDGVRIKDVEVVRDKLTSTIVSNSTKFIGLGARFRDSGLKDGMMDDLYVYSRVLSDNEVLKIHDPSITVKPDYNHYLFSKSDQYKSHLKKLTDKVKHRNKFHDSLKSIMVMKDKPTKAYAHILDRGGYDNKREKVYPKFPKGLYSDFKGFNKKPENRMDLVNWLLDPNHPLTARVAVNRYWQMIFGTGLVSTAEDFGTQGSSPTHPKLLDWLARDFVDSKWNLKSLLKKMVTSSTYKQSAILSNHKIDKDPENKYLSRSPSYQISAEMIRDNALFASKLLDNKFGGTYSIPYDMKVSFKPKRPSKNSSYRRSLYTIIKPIGPSPVMTTFDASKRDVCRVKRERTMSPLQSLILLNGTQFIEASKVIAYNLIEKYGTDDEKIIKDAFRILTSRYPDHKEYSLLKDLLHEQIPFFDSDAKKVKSFLSVGDKEIPLNKLTSKLAATTVLVSAIMNLHEVNSKK